MRNKIQERAGLEKISLYHGGPQLPGIALDANENNWPMPEEVYAALQSGWAGLALNRYPQIDAAGLRHLLAESLGLGVGNVAVGNGSSELLFAACYAFGGARRKIGYIYPSFSMYQTYAELSGGMACPFPLEPDFSLDCDKLKACLRQEKPHLFIICNPNHPTGTLYQAKELLRLLPEAPCPVLLDEAYMEFAGQSLLPYLAEHGNLAVFRTFSKAYGLASGRVGYLLSANEAIIQAVSKALLPYHVNAFSLLAAQTVYQRRALYKSIVSGIIKERERLAGEIASLGWQACPSATNFVFFSTGQREANGQLVRHLAGQGIYVRDFSAHPALAGIRMTVGTQEENQAALAAMKDFAKRAGQAKL
jgi:histidinol-phosphate aminotransferase